MTGDFGAFRWGRTLRRDRRAQPLPLRRGQARRASACRVAAAEGTEQRTAKRPGSLKASGPTARAPSTRTVPLVGERRQIVACRLRFGACRSCAASMLRPSYSPSLVRPSRLLRAAFARTLAVDDRAAERQSQAAAPPQFCESLRATALAGYRRKIGPKWRLDNERRRPKERPGSRRGDFGRNSARLWGKGTIYPWPHACRRPMAQ